MPGQFGPPFAVDVVQGNVSISGPADHIQSEVDGDVHHTEFFTGEAADASIQFRSSGIAGDPVARGLNKVADISPSDQRKRTNNRGNIGG